VTEEVKVVSTEQTHLNALAHAPLVEADGAVVEPAVVVELRPDLLADLVEALAGARRSGRLLVGVVPAGPVPELARLLDLTLAPRGSGTSRCAVEVDDPGAVAETVAGLVRERPGAALTLAWVLRIVEQLDGQSGVHAESHAYSMLLAGPDFRGWLATRARRRPPVAPSGELVRSRRVGDVLEVVLDHPERRNAYSARLRDQLHDSLRVAVLDPSVRRVVLSGAGPGFCAGGDLDEFGTTADPVFAHLLRTTAGVAGTLELLRPRLEVRVHGHTVGAGVELAAFGSLVRASADATFRLPEVAMGLMPGAGGTVSITRRIGRWRAAYLLLSGERLDAHQALAWGLVDEVET